MTTAEPTPAVETWEAWEARNGRLIRRAGLILILFGVFWRVFRYGMAMPIWGDEAMLLVNYQYRVFGFADLFGPIDYCQIAPLLFHAAEMTAINLFGTSEWAVRLPPLLGSLVGLGLFWLLARLTLSPLGRMLAVGILAVAIWPATTGALTKPYTWDMMFGTAFLIPLAAWLNNPVRRWPLVVLCALAPVGLTGSYPAVFVAGGVWVGLARPVWLSRDRYQQALLLLYGLLVAGTFLAHYEFVGKAHLASNTFGTTTQAGMNNYWEKANAFPPADPLKLLLWIPGTFAGEIFAYPIGGQRGVSLLTVILCVVGARGLWRRERGAIVVAVIAGFVMWLIAATFHKYPMGSCRLGQHAAGGFCLLAGAGAADLIHKFVPERRARGAVIAAAAILLVIGLGGISRDLFRPFRDLEAKYSREAVRDITGVNDAPILVVQPRMEVRVSSIQWYLGTHGDRVTWGAREADWNALLKGRSAVWVVSCTEPVDRDEERVFTERMGPEWTCTTHYFREVTGHFGPDDFPPNWYTWQTFRCWYFERTPSAPG